MPGASVAQPREGAVSVVLDDGRVLVIGGRAASGPVATVEALNADGAIAVLPSMSSPRVGHTAVVLADGSVLVAGGTTLVATDQGTVEAPTSSAEIFVPGPDAWVAVSPLNVARTRHTAAVLADGRVLLAGGTGEQGSLDSTEVFEPLQGTFRAAGLLSAARSDAAAAVAGETQVLVVGGRNTDGVLATADLVDVDSGGVAQIALASPRAGASATRLLDGAVLVAGGNNGTDDLASAELIDPVSGTSSTVGSMSQPRIGHQATLLDHNANVLVSGGTNGGAIVATTEHFIPWTGQFVAYDSPATPRPAAVLSNTSTEGVAALMAGRCRGWNPDRSDSSVRIRDGEDGQERLPAGTVRHDHRVRMATWRDGQSRAARDRPWCRAGLAADRNRGCGGPDLQRLVRAERRRSWPPVLPDGGWRRGDGADDLYRQPNGQRRDSEWRRQRDGPTGRLDYGCRHCHYGQRRWEQ